MPSMPQNTERDVALLRRLADSPQASQRELARDTGVSLGKINYALRALIDKGPGQGRQFQPQPARRAGALPAHPQRHRGEGPAHPRLPGPQDAHDQLAAEIETLKGEVGHD